MSELKTILLVEDNEDNLVVYRTILEHVGYRVIEARDGEEGVNRAPAPKDRKSMRWNPRIPASVYPVDPRRRGW